MIEEQTHAVRVILHDILSNMGLGNAKITIETLELIIRSYNDMDMVDRRKIRQSFEILGFEDISYELLNPSEADNSSNYVCPVIKTYIHTKCCLRECRYHTDREQSYNCLLIESGRKSLTPAQLSDIFGYSVSDINNIRIGAIKKMRRSAVDVAKTNSDLKVEFIYLKTDKVCSICEMAMSEVYYHEGDVYICSDKCLNSRNPAEAVIEARYGIPSDKVIRWVLNNFDSIDVAAQAIGFPSSVLSRIITSM